MDKVKPTKKAKKVSVHYVNNKEFSIAVVEYVNTVKEANENGTEVPIIPNYIGECFMKITEGLSHAPNFIRYSYRDEMVMDANENCVKAIMNYDINKATRTGLPNAFAYFTQISYFAFLRRIQKEKKQYDIKLKYIESASINAFADFGMDGTGCSGDSLISKVRSRTDSIRHKDDSFIEDDQFKELMPKKKAIKRGWQKKAPALTTAELTFDSDGSDVKEKIEEAPRRMVKTITRRSKVSA